MNFLSVNWNYNINKKINLTINFIGTLALNFVHAIQIIFGRDTSSGRLYSDNFLEFLRKIIWNCLPIATLTVSASSIIFAIHLAPEFSKRGLSIYLGGLVALALIRESVPVMASLAIITQFCSGMTSQIGSMKITEQLDAMKVSNVRPVAYLLVPMLLAGLVGFPVMTLICMLIGLVVNFFTCNFLIKITPHIYLTSVSGVIVLKDIFLALVKTSIFGFVVCLISFTCGVLTTGGSKGLGSATRLSVVINFALVVILDYIITAIWL